MSAFESGLTLLLDAFERLAPGEAELASAPLRPPRTCLHSIQAAISMALPGLALRRLLMQARVRTVAVAVPDVLRQDATEVLLNLPA
jgi:hypothetical protein